TSVIVDDDNTVKDQESDEVISKSISPKSIQEKIAVEEKPVAAIAQPTVNVEANFTIQVAAESNADVAVQIVNRLIEAGYDAYLQEYITVSNRIVYRVRIGKFATLNNATQAASKITNDQGLPIWVTKYKK
ncbi:MAG: SPOR domain-containing protein, partial [Candidatus Neomarinimicrobiota bacterium]